MNRKSLTQSCSILIALVVAFASFTLANAQINHWINIESLSNTKFPLVEAHVSAFNVEGLPIQGLTPGNFSVFEDGQKVVTFDAASFMNTEKPLAIALVIDTSGSMNAITSPTPLQNAVQSAKTFVAELTPNDYVAVISFADDPTVVQDLTTDRALVNQALDSLKPTTNTALYEAIVKGVDVLKNRPERRIMVLLTDGTETTPNREFTFDQAANEAKKWTIPVYPIGFGDAKKDELQNLAAMTLGVAQIHADTSALQGAFTQILQILRQQYKITYTSAIPSDGKAHTLLIGLDFQDKHDEVSRSFTAQLPTTIQITKPLEGETLKYNTTQVNSPIQISAEAYALTSVDKVELLLDGQSITTFNAQPYEYQWDLTNVNQGSHTISMVLTAKDGSTDTAEVNVKVERVLPIENPFGMLWIAGLILLAVAAVLIPLSIRSRRRRGQAVSGAALGNVQAGTACLRELEGMNPDQVWPLGMAEVRLGRKREENDIPLQGLKASRRQAVIRFEQGRYVIYSLNPENPVLVNGSAVTEAHVLQPGDTLRLGETLLRYEQ
jgi:Ca-activated chloride channel family protein